MNASIKIIKREDAKDLVPPGVVLMGNEKKAEIDLHRKMVKTVSTWIAETRENNRAANIAAIHKMLGFESIFSETASSQNFQGRNK